MVRQESGYVREVGKKYRTISRGGYNLLQLASESSLKKSLSPPMSLEYMIQTWQRVRTRVHHGDGPTVMREVALDCLFLLFHCLFRHRHILMTTLMCLAGQHCSIQDQHPSFLAIPVLARLAIANRFATGDRNLV